MRTFLSEFVNPTNVNNDHIKRFCFTNNIRSKYLTIFLLFISVILTSYDVLILQKVSDFKFFLINFKTDVVLLVASFIFTVYIYFNQVKSYKEINRQHKLIHGIISVFILFWTSFKSLLYIDSDIVSSYFIIVSFIILSVVFIFPKMVFLAQLITTMVFYIVGLFVLHISLNKVIYDAFFIGLFIVIAYVISVYIYTIQTRLLIKESELSSFKKNGKS